MGRVVELADVAVELEAGEGPIAPGVAHLIDHLPPARSHAAATIIHSPVGPPVPERTADVELGRLTLWVDASEVHVLDVTGASARLTERVAQIGGGGARANNGFHALFLFALTHLLAYHDRFVLHGAAVANGVGAVVVLGGTGAGKSTLAVALADAGWLLLSDDMVVIRQTDAGSLEVTGVPRPVTVPPDMSGSFPARALSEDPRGRVVVQPPLHRGWSSVGALVVVGHDASPGGSVRPYERHAMFHQALGAFVSTVNPPLLRRFMPIAGALSRLPGWGLGHGTDPRTRRHDAVRLLTALAPPSP